MRDGWFEWSQDPLDNSIEIGEPEHEHGAQPFCDMPGILGSGFLLHGGWSLHAILMVLEGALNI